MKRVGKGWVQGTGMTASEFKVSLGDGENVLKLDDSDGCTTLHILKTIELCTLNGSLYHINCTSVKLFFKTCCQKRIRSC